MRAAALRLKRGRPFVDGVMKRLFLFVLFPLISWAAGEGGRSLRIASYNIRYDNPEDVLQGNGWEGRREHVCALIRFHDFDIVGLQEVTHRQMIDLSRLEGYAHVGVGRDDGKEAGEYSPILFKRDRFKLVNSGTFWLSATPDEVSFGWDAICRRICTWAELQDVRTGQIFQLWNTHFDHRGIEARKNSALLMTRRIEALLERGIILVVVGDFNSTPESDAYKIFGKILDDARDKTSTAPYGPRGSTNGFVYRGEFEHRIDHIFISKGIGVSRHGILTDSYNNKFPSDHFPVVAEITLPNEK